MQHATSPLISCLCVTRNKPEQLKRAINCFHSQTYPNKELIIIFEDNDPATKKVVSAFSKPSIRSFEISSSPKLSLGNLRNLSIEMAAGEYFCQWDDDDWYHERRLEVQLDAIIRSHKPACFLAYWLMYDRVNSRSFLSPVGPWPGTILCKKSIIGPNLKYSDFKRHEDHMFMMDLIGLKYAYPLVMPSLYIYSYHGKNTFGQAHFDELFNKSQEFPDYITELFRKIFHGEMSDIEASKLLTGPALNRAIDYFYGNTLPIMESDDEAWNSVTI